MKNKCFSDIVEMIKNTYCFYRQKYVVMSNRYTKTVGHYFKDGVIQSHLDGGYALAVFAGEKVTRFISVDVDEGGKKAVRQVMDAFVELGIPRDKIFISTSGRKGYHVDIFFNPWIYNNKARNLYELMIWRTGLNPKKVEFRPTPTQSVKIPLGVHATTGNRCWYLDRDTLEPIEDFAYIKEITPVANTLVEDILRDWNKKRWNELYCEMICEDTGHDRSVGKDVVFDDAYYEAHALRDAGTRHDTMVEIACDLRHYGANRFQIDRALRGFYYHQDPLYMESSEREVLEDIQDIAEWAETSVPVFKQRPSPNDGVVKPITFEKNEINYILTAPTSAARKVALLLWTYCKRFGAAHMSYETIGETIGCTSRTVALAVKELVDGRFFWKQSGGCHYERGRLVRRTNTYFIPSEKTKGCPDAGDLVVESYTTNERVTKENFDSYYNEVLTAMCSQEYLAQFLTKPELKECEEWRNKSN